MNAIERLRAKPVTVADWHQRADALAAVDALYQAAKAAAEHDPAETEGREHLYALAAAVRRVEGSQ